MGSASAINDNSIKENELWVINYSLVNLMQYDIITDLI